MELNKDNYFSLEANRHYMSVSQFKSFLPAYGGCEAQAMAVLNGDFEPKPIEAFIEGHYVHAWNEGTLEEFKANNPDLYNTKGKNKGELKANFKHCEKMIETLKNDPFITTALEGQKEVIITTELFGIPWKVMLDSYNPDGGYFSDIKTMRDMDGKHWNKSAQAYENFIDHYGYNLQMAIYAEVEKQATQKDIWLIPQIVVVTKQDPPDHELIYFDFDAIEHGLYIVGSYIDRVRDVKSGKEAPNRCGKCDFCRASKKLDRIKHYSELAIY
ncbi:hypothetical protein D3C76_630550 [compost metagenome]